MKGGGKMAVNVIPVTARLQLRLNTGLDENFNPVYRTRSFSNVKPGADNEDLFELAQEIGMLQVHNLEAVRRLDEVELEAV
jgi:hypothetical protein